MNAPITLTGLLATYAAVLSSIGLGWTLYRDLHDRPRLQAHARLVRMAPGVGGQVYAVHPNLDVADRSEALFIVMDVTNVGRRPIRWDGWAARRYKPDNGKDHFAIVPASLPKMLTEGDSHAEWTKYTGDFDIDNVKRLFIWDASGRKWYVPRRVLGKLKRDCHKFQPTQDENSLPEQADN